MAGLKSKKKKSASLVSTKPKSKTVKFKKVPYKSDKKYDSVEWNAASRYADHMGYKFNLSPAEINKNTESHYQQAMSDSKFRFWLLDEYGG